MQDKIDKLSKLTSGRMPATMAKELILETTYLRRGNSGDKWPSLYGDFKFWFSVDKHLKVRLSWDSNATKEAIATWKDVADELYGNRLV